MGVKLVRTCFLFSALAILGCTDMSAKEKYLPCSSELEKYRVSSAIEGVRLYFVDNEIVFDSSGELTEQGIALISSLSDELTDTVARVDICRVNQAASYSGRKSLRKISYPLYDEGLGDRVYVRESAVTECGNVAVEGLGPGYLFTCYRAE